MAILGEWGDARLAQEFDDVEVVHFPRDGKGPQVEFGGGAKELQREAAHAYKVGVGHGEGNGNFATPIFVDCTAFLWRAKFAAYGIGLVLLTRAAAAILCGRTSRFLFAPPVFCTCFRHVDSIP